MPDEIVNLDLSHKPVGMAQLNDPPKMIIYANRQYVRSDIIPAPKIPANQRPEFKPTFYNAACLTIGLVPLTISYVFMKIGEFNIRIVTRIVDHMTRRQRKQWLDERDRYQSHLNEINHKN